MFSHATCQSPVGLASMRKIGLNDRFIFVAATATLLWTVGLERSAYADDVNVTGQSRQTPGTGPSHPGNPGEGDKPLLPGDQPAKQGTDPSSPVHNVDPRDLEGKKHKESEKTP